MSSTATNARAKRMAVTRPPMREIQIADLAGVDFDVIDGLAPHADYAVVLHRGATVSRPWRAKVYARKGAYGLLPIADVGPCRSDTGARSAAHAIAMRHAARYRRAR